MKRFTKALCMLLALVMVAGMLPLSILADGTQATHTVKFNLNYNGAPQIPAQKVAHGECATQPENVTREGWIFQYWYVKNGNGIQKFDLTQPVTEDMTLYARWDEDINYWGPIWSRNLQAASDAGKADSNTYTVTFDPNGADVTGMPAAQRVKEGGYATEPAEPTRAGYLFGGWYKDKECLIPYYFDTQVYKDTTFYARWNHTDPGLYAIGAMLYNAANQEIQLDVSTDAACNLNLYILNEEQTNILYSHKQPVAGTLDRETITHIVSGCTMPTYFVIIAVLTDDAGNELSNHFTYIEHTHAYEDFLQKTVDDFPQGTVINLDENKDKNFVVVQDDVQLITLGADTNVVYNEESGNFIFTGNITKLLNMKPSQKYAIHTENNVYLLYITNFQSDGSILVAQADEGGLEDFLTYIKIDVSGYAVKDTADDSNTFSLQSIPDIDIDLSSEIKIEQGWDWEDDSYSLSGSFSGALKLHVVIFYDYKIGKLFGAKDYFKCEVSSEIESKIEISAEQKYEHPPKETIEDFIFIGECKLPFGITGLNAVVKLTTPYKFEISNTASVSCIANMTTSIKYNTVDGLQKTKTTHADPKISAETTITIGMGLQLALGVELWRGVVTISIPAYLGIATTATATMYDSTQTDTPSKHMCNLCLDGEVFLEFSIGASLSYKITKHFTGTPFNVTLYKAKLPFLDYYISVINSTDSVHGGKIKFGLGDCPNIAWRTICIAKTAAGKETSDRIEIHNTGKHNGTMTASGDSKFTTYLYNDTYFAKATISGENCIVNFQISNSPKTIILTPNGGSVVDPAPDPTPDPDPTPTETKTMRIRFVDSETQEVLKISEVIPDNYALLSIGHTSQASDFLYSYLNPPKGFTIENDTFFVFPEIPVITAPENYTFTIKYTTNTYFMPDTDIIPTSDTDPSAAEWNIQIPVLKQKLIVGDVTVTKDNAADILGDGTAKYDYATNTLTLINADITAQDAVYSNHSLSIIIPEGTTSRLKTTKIFANYPAAISLWNTLSTYPEGYLSISGGGKLCLSGSLLEEDDRKYYTDFCVYAGVINLSDITIEISTSWGGFYSLAEENGITENISLSNVHLSEDTPGSVPAYLLNARGSIQISDSVIEDTSPSGAMFFANGTNSNISILNSTLSLNGLYPFDVRDGTLHIQNSTVHIKDDEKIEMLCGAITLTGVKIVTPANGIIYNNGETYYIANPDGSYPTEILIR